MILVMNKKNGVGCTILTYNLGRLFNIPIYVKPNSFMLDDEHQDYFQTVKKIAHNNTLGILDIGTDVEKKYVQKFLKDGIVNIIVIPMDFGYETILKTRETAEYIREINDTIDIVFILNRLDKNDRERDFNYRNFLLEQFPDLTSTHNYHLTYLRNSYSLFSNMDIGEYLFEKCQSEEITVRRGYGFY